MKKYGRQVIAGVLGGLSMWIIAGLWHNLVLPLVSETAEAHHEGLAIMLIAYIILGLLMSFIYSLASKGGKPVVEGLKIGVVIGILWVFPHGLTMAAVHDTSIWYEIHNAVWHMVEQGAGGIVIALVIGKKQDAGERTDRGS